MSPNVSAQGVYEAAKEKWGIESQVMMLFEEMGELQQAMCHYGRLRCSRLKVAEEIADVEIMLEQIKYIFSLEGPVEKKREQKLKRLRKVLQCPETK